jgi:periplasmic protein CpxP/Spy
MVVLVGAGRGGPGKGNGTMIETTNTKPTLTRSRRRWLLFAAPVALIGGTMATSAFAFGPGWHGWGGGDPEKMEKMVDRRVDRMLDSIDASADQKTRVKGTIARLRPQLRALRAEKHKLHEAGAKALAADRVDPNEIERLRREALKLAERGSTLVSGGLVEIAQVLNPEQRRELLEHFQRHGGGHGPF